MLFRRGKPVQGECLPNGHVHDFHAVYDEQQEADGAKVLYLKTYIRHVCIDCGATVERNEAPVTVYANNAS
jgi:hypothetical protein